MVIALVAAFVATAAAAFVGFVLLLGDDDPPARPAPTVPTAAAPTLGGDPPTDLRLDDRGDNITLTWTDPTGGTVPFIVSAARGAGQEMRTMGAVTAGETRFVAHGLNDRLDYCFTVVAVYATDRYAASAPVCTRRDAASPR
jgi:hypothetical protein